jgi:sugar lactone lactonase YvrE
MHPRWAVPGGVVHLEGASLPVQAGAPPQVYVGEAPARVLGASPSRVRLAVPPVDDDGWLPVRLEPGGVSAGDLLVARPIATGLHQVDSPAYDGLGRLYVTHSGSRGVKVPVPLYRIHADGGREPIAIDLPNPTSMTLGPDGAMFVSSRFEGQVYRLAADDSAEVYASDLGVPTGLAFSREGVLFVGDRSGSILRVSRAREVDVFATLPASVAAFHLAFGPDDCLYVSAPTLSAHDAIYRITPDRLVDTLYDGFGRPQGLAFDRAGALYVAEALAGASGIYRLDVSVPAPVPELVAAAPVVVGLALDPEQGLNVASNDTVWKLAAPVAAPAHRTPPG